MYTKIWHVGSQSSKVAVVLRHDTLIKSKRIFVQGKCVADLSSEKFDHESFVPIGGGAVVVLKVKCRGIFSTSYEYELLYHGTVIPEYTDIKDSADSCKLNAWITDAVVDDTGVAFIVSATLRRKGSASGAEVIAKTEKRYSDFLMLHRMVTSAYRGNAVVERVPTLPPRQFKIAVNHSNPEFLRQRRDELNTYLIKLSKMPRITYNPDMLQFLKLPESIGMPIYASPDQVVVNMMAVPEPETPLGDLFANKKTEDAEKRNKTQNPSLKSSGQDVSYGQM